MIISSAKCNTIHILEYVKMLMFEDYDSSLSRNRAMRLKFVSCRREAFHLFFSEREL
jgi:hypothetical protein